MVRRGSSTSCIGPAASATLAAAILSRACACRPSAFSVLIPALAAWAGASSTCPARKLTHVAHGVIVTRAADGLGLRLLKLHGEVARIIAELRARRHRGGAGLRAQGPVRGAQARPCPRRRAAGRRASRPRDRRICAQPHQEVAWSASGHAGKEQVQAMVKPPAARLRRGSRPMRPTRSPPPSPTPIWRARGRASWRRSHDRETDRHRGFRRRGSRHPRCRRRRLSGALPVLDPVASWRRARTPR